MKVVKILKARWEACETPLEGFGGLLYHHKITENVILLVDRVHEGVCDYFVGQTMTRGIGTETG